ncbi:MAG TPA: G1 family glutamic endopeptidase [Candidatus Dormibacteraeota bacterium]|nr:G1 family glutamic endopeptidase [Candidatus Dormibacteraeota bacterium]
MLQQIAQKLNLSKLLIGHALSLWTPAVLGVSLFTLALLQPMPTHMQIDSQKMSDKKITHHVSTVPKVTQPVAAAPKVAAAQPSSPPVTPAKTRSQAETPKPEPVATPSPSSNVSGLTPTAPAPAPASSQVPSSQTTTGYTSTNWSGYLATTGSFIGVSGSWAATSPTGNGSTTSADSTWIGIGGVTAGDLIQVGTQNIVAANGQVSASAFYEMLPNVSQPVPGVTVSPNDSMSASVTEISSGRWAITITDNTDGESDTLDVSYASSLSSAEWIEEDPSYSFRLQIPFDNFHGASFTNARTTLLSGTSANLANSTAQPVTMVDDSGNNIAVPSAIGGDGTSFTVNP